MSPSHNIQDSIQRVSNVVREILDRDIDQVAVSSKRGPLLHTQLQTFFNLKFSNPIDRTTYEIILTHAMAAEKLGPGGFRHTLTTVCRHLDGSQVCMLDRTSRHPTLDDLKRVLEASVGSRVVRAMVWEALSLTGLGGKIIVEKTHASVPSVELVAGYTFNLQQLIPIDFSFLCPRVACIDGYIESVGEIHHLLEAASSAKEPCVLFVRGVSDDVKQTLKVNYDRGSLRVMPVGVRFDLEGMNTLVDLSAVTSADMISSLKGDLISSIKFHELPTVKQLTMFRGKMAVLTPGVNRSVKDLVKNLRERREATQIDDLGVLLDKRIRSLTPNHVMIRLVDDKEYVINSQAIDAALRTVRSAIEHGLAEDGTPAATSIASGIHAKKCIESLTQLGAVVVND